MCRAFEIHGVVQSVHRNRGRDRRRSPGSAVEQTLGFQRLKIHVQDQIPEHSVFPQPLFLVNLFVFH